MADRKQYEQDCLMIFKKVSETLNQQIQQGGKLERNNTHIWAMLHAMDNDIWRAYIDGIKIINKEFGHLVKMDEIATVLETQKTLDRYGDLSTSNNILTPFKTRVNGHNYKGTAWKLICQGREIWCRAMDIDLPNEDSSKRTLAEELFE